MTTVFQLCDGSARPARSREAGSRETGSREPGAGSRSYAGERRETPASTTNAGDAVHGRVGLTHALERPELGPHLVGREGARDVAAAIAVVLDMRVVGPDGLPVRCHVAAVAAGADRRIGDLHGDRFRPRLGEVHLQFGAEVCVHVAGDHDRVRRLRVLHPRVEPVAGAHVAIPLVHVVSAVGRRLGHVAREGKDLLADQGPSRARRRQVVEEPPFLPVAEHRALRVHGIRTAGPGPVAARLIGSVLTRVQHAQVRQRSELQAAVDLHPAAAGKRGPPQGHVLVVRLERGRAAQQEHLARRIVVACVAGVVVGHFVIVPAHHERRRLVSRAQVVVRLVLRVAQTVVGDAEELVPQMLPYLAVQPSVGRPRLVDVIPRVQHEVEVALRDAPVDAEVAVFVVRAAADGKAKAIDGGAGRGRGPGAPDLADLPPDSEAVEVLARGLEPLHLHVDAVGQLGIRRGRALLLDGAEQSIARHLPRHVQRSGRHAAAVFERTRRQPGPQHDAVGQWIPGRDAERERILGEELLGAGASRREGLHDRGRAHPRSQAQHLASGQPRQHSIVVSERRHRRSIMADRSDGPVTAGRRQAGAIARRPRSVLASCGVATERP